MIPFHGGIGKQRGWRFGALAQVIERTEKLFLRNFAIPLAKRVGADSLEVAVPVHALVFEQWYFKTTAKSVGRKTLKKQLSSVPTQKTVSRVIAKKSAKQTIHFTSTLHQSYRTICGTSLSCQFL